MTRIVGFLKWPDFFREIEREAPAVVRIQAYHRLRRHGGSLPEEEFFVEAAFAAADEIRMVRFRLGSERRDILEDDPDRREEFRRRMAEAERILALALAPYGVETRPGLFVKEDPPFETDPTGLWRWEQAGPSLRLVPEVPVEASP
jgi:hypothetical protein